MLLVAASISMILVRADVPAPEVRSKHASIKDEFLSGIKFVYNHSILFPAMTLDMISVMFGGVTALLPIFADEILHVGPKGLGALRAAPAIGATIMSLYLTNSKRLRSGHALLTAVAGFGVCILVFGLSHNFFLSIFALAVSGCFDSVSMVIRSSAVQLTSPDDMRGKNFGSEFDLYRIIKRNWRTRIWYRSKTLGHSTSGLRWRHCMSRDCWICGLPRT